MMFKGEPDYESGAPLLDDSADMMKKPAPIDATPWWRWVHALSFLTGGVTFCAGTGVLYLPDDWVPVVSAMLYTVGSVAFLTVDVQEFFTYTEQTKLRLNIATSATGSALYVLGSLGFLPSIAASVGPNLGSVGFDAGSAVIAASQSVKVARLLREQADTSAVCVEACAGVGATCFLIGTAGISFLSLDTVLAVWMLGSLAFTAGGAFLAYRHAVLGV